MRRFTLTLFLVSALTLATLPLISSAQNQSATDRAPIQLRPEVTNAVRHDTSKPLREMMPLKAGKAREYENPMNFSRKNVPADQKDGAVQSSAVLSVPIVTGLNFEGIGEGLPGYNVNVAPPDTTGDVGGPTSNPQSPTGQYVQWVNLSFAVFDKASGVMIYGPAAGNTLWSGFGGPCQTTNNGDPIVQYDQIANVWVLTQFAVASAPYRQCVAVSQTSDATGAYNRYEFTYANALNDYPKLGVWPDAYYITYNIFNNGATYGGPKVCALDRARMIAGLSATQQCFQLSTAFGSLLPADVDGPTLPPAGAPNYMISDGTNALSLWKFHVDWVTPANTTLTGPVNIPVAAFAHPCPTTQRGACVPQPSTNQKLESLADRLMYRFAYRNFGTHESLVVNQAVKVGTNKPTTRTGIRWYELRNPGGSPPTVFQQSTYAPDTGFWRWMGSAAMDKDGNLAVGYSISDSSSLRPTLRFAARAVGDPLNTLSSEQNLFTGTGSQTQNLARWGDYSTLSVDPSDDCTMWYTNEYLAVNGTFNWHTRIASFKLGTCN
ncbi:MAG TPA: hypothetical protein VMZ30_01275 [Pyrinomonadaceae bacterium]|nr:hypothetical protein [Pyrinomonadaceae bacterium]